MLLKVLHGLAAHPWIYDRIQELAGVNRIYRRLSGHISRYGSRVRVLDIGGGTGTLRRLWPKGCTYICLDLELAKLRGFRSKFSDGLALLCDASRMPVAPESVDVAVCMFVAHHLDDSTLDNVVRECIGVLKPRGKLIFLDPLDLPRRLISRVLWALDRGSHPRTSEVLRNCLEANCRITHWETFKIYHQYLFAIGEKSACAEPSLIDHAEGG
jgi:SAM-dependent methyltransferase